MTDKPFRIVEVIYPGMTQLDFTGPHTVFSRLPNTEIIVASEQGGSIESDGGLTFAGTVRMADIDRCDLLFFPGGFAVTEVINDTAFMGEVARLAPTARYLTSVCTGSLVLAAAGLLTGRTATSHWSTYAELGAHGAVPVSERVVEHLDDRVSAGQRRCRSQRGQPGGQMPDPLTLDTHQPVDVPAPGGAGLGDLGGTLADHPQWIGQHRPAA